MAALLGNFTEVAAWFWSEIGLLLAFMSLFFVGAIVSFFIRVFHSV